MKQIEPDTPAMRLAGRMARLQPEQRALLGRRLSGKRVRGCELVARALKAGGIDHVYGVWGQPSGEVLPACAARSIRPIGVYHQTSAVCMATAHNYQAGRLAAAAVISGGPAATNAATGLLVARDNDWPVVVLGGRRSSFQKFDALPALSCLAKKAIAVPATDALEECIRDACIEAVSGRPGPVFVELHEDVLAASECETQRPAETASAPPSLPSVSCEQVRAISAALLAAHRPALLLGEGIRWSVDPGRLRELIESVGLPFITSPMGRGFVPDDHPLCFNSARTALQSHADVVLILGARLNWIFRHGAELSREARVFRVDILGDKEGTDDAPAVRVEPVHSDAGDFVNRLYDEFKTQADEVADIDRRGRIKAWRHLLKEAAAGTQARLDAKTSCDGRPMSAYRMMKEIRDALPREAICICDGNLAMIVAQQVIPAFAPAARMDAGTSACMGVGIPFAIGSKLACPDRPVVAITGDYGFSLSAMEMEVCVRHKIPVLVVVANNSGISGSLRQKMYFPHDYPERVAMFQPGIEYDRMMKMFGGRGLTIDDPGLLKSAVENALASGGPWCVNVMIDPDTPLMPAWGEQGSIVRGAG